MSQPRPAALDARALAPDLARGALLLFIVIANAPWYLADSGTRLLSAWPAEASLADRIVQSISLIAIDGRSYPMFAALFGYGIWQLYSRQTAAGVSVKDARRLLQRRHAWMLAFGFVHAALLWAGDIVGAYGLVGLVIVWFFLGRRDRTLVVWASVLGLLLVIIAVMSAVGGAIVAALDEPARFATDTGLDLGVDTSSYPESILVRLGTWAVLTPAQAFVGMVVPAAILVAIVAARHRVLEEPAAHSRLLWWVAGAGIGAGWLGGAVVAAQNAGALGIPVQFDWMFSGLQSVTGLACGLGYVAAFGLIAARIRQPGRVVSAIRALGARSLTFYLAQSLAFAPVMSAWGLGLGAQLSSWSIVAYAIAVWVVSVVAAAVLDARGIRGPAEWLLRRLAYPRAQRASRSTTAP